MRMRWWNGRNGCTRSTCFAALSQPFLRKRFRIKGWWGHALTRQTPLEPALRACVRARMHMCRIWSRMRTTSSIMRTRIRCVLDVLDLLFSCSVSCCCSPLTRWRGERERREGGGERGGTDTRGLLFSCSVSCCCSPVPSLVRCLLCLRSLSIFFPLFLGRTKMMGRSTWRTSTTRPKVFLRERKRESERERALLGTLKNGGAMASPAYDDSS